MCPSENLYELLKLPRPSDDLLTNAPQAACSSSQRALHTNSSGTYTSGVAALMTLCGSSRRPFEEREGCVAARWSSSTRRRRWSKFWGALRSHPAVQRRKLKSTGHLRRSLQMSFSGPEPDRPGRNPSLVTMWQATPSSVILERIVIKMSERHV